MGFPCGLGAWTCLCPSLSSAQRRFWHSSALQGPSKLCGESATRVLGETGGKRGETKPFDFKTNAERLSSEQEHSQAPALSAWLVLILTVRSS